MHELVENCLELDGLVELVPGEGGGEQHEGGEVQRVPVVALPLPHADACNDFDALQNMPSNV